jgi:hypothetical protein
MEYKPKRFYKEACVVAGRSPRFQDQFDVEIEEDCLFIHSFEIIGFVRSEHFIITVPLGFNCHFLNNKKRF